MGQSDGHGAVSWVTPARQGEGEALGDRHGTRRWVTPMEQGQRTPVTPMEQGHGER